MFSNIGWTEMLVVATVAIIVVGPKDLPGMLRTFGSFMKKVRGMAGDFQKQFDDALKEAELDGVKDTLNEVRSLDPTKKIRDGLKNEMTKVEKSINEDSHPASVFDESKAPEIAGGEKVDVDAALARQKELDETAVKAPPQSGKNAVPGFASDATEVKKARKPAAVRKKTPAKKKKPAEKVAAARKTAAKRSAAKPKKSKPAAKSKASTS